MTKTVKNKSYKITAYETKKYTLVIDAIDAAEALDKASEITPGSNKWDEDYDAYMFEVSDAEQYYEE